MRLAVLETVGTVVAVATALFASAGSVRWPMAWVFLLFFVAFAVIGLVTLSPSLVAERSRLLAKGERGDAVLSVGFALLLYPATLVACGLDRRWGWSGPLPILLVQVPALGIFLAGYGFALWAMRVNPFFSPVVRIQSERGRHLVDQGPYRWVRHPGYAGTLVAHLAVPVALGSVWGLVPAVTGGFLLALRALREEHVLRHGLGGYADYMARVRWRLFPGVW